MQRRAGYKVKVGSSLDGTKVYLTYQVFIVRLAQEATRHFATKERTRLGLCGIVSLSHIAT